MSPRIVTFSPSIFPERREFGLKLANLGAHDIGAMVQHLGDGLVDSLADARLLPLQVDERQWLP
jgi:hypothetical protein